MRSQGGPRRAWPRRREEMVRASARVRGAPARVERPLATTLRVELPVREHAPRSGGGAPITSCLIPLTVACQAHVASSSATPTRKFQRRARARVVGAAWVWVGLRWAPGARQLWGARLRVDHRPDGALASSAELSGSAEPSGRAVAASPGCRTSRQSALGAGAAHRAPERRRRARDLRQSARGGDGARRGGMAATRAKRESARQASRGWGRAEPAARRRLGDACRRLGDG